MARIPVPLLGESCNRCGACCEVGGSCIFRKWVRGEEREWDFTGRCEFLRDEPDGATACTALERCDQTAPWFKRYVPGTCDFTAR